jgi:hypothetical protein
MAIIEVNAEEIYYSDYGDWSSWQTEEIFPDDLTMVEKEKRYRWYKREKIYSDNYYLSSYNDDIFPYIDWDDYILGEYSEYSKEMPDSIPGRLIKQKKVYEYRNMKPIRYIYILNSHNGYYYFRIPEINVWVNDVMINYNYYCAFCSDNFKDYINDGNIFQSDVFIRSGYELRIDLGGYYDASDIKLDLYLYDPHLSHKTYEVIFSSYSLFDSQRAFYKAFDEEFYCNSIDEVKKFEYRVDTSWLDEPEWFDWEISEELVEESLTTEVNSITLFSYSDPFYRRYQIVNNYYDGRYYKDAPDVDYIKDEEDYIYYYRYKIRELIETDNDEEENDEEVENNKNIEDEELQNTEEENDEEVENNKDIEDEELQNNEKEDNKNIEDEKLQNNERENNESNLDLNESNVDNKTTSEAVLDNSKESLVKEESDLTSKSINKVKEMAEEKIDEVSLIEKNNIEADDNLNEKDVANVLEYGEEKELKTKGSKKAIIKPLLYILSLAFVGTLLLIRKYKNRIL